MKTVQFVQLVTTQHKLFGLDKKGRVWELCVDAVVDHEWWELKPEPEDQL